MIAARPPSGGLFFTKRPSRSQAVSIIKTFARLRCTIFSCRESDWGLFPPRTFVSGGDQVLPRPVAVAGEHGFALGLGCAKTRFSAWRKVMRSTRPAGASWFAGASCDFMRLSWALRRAAAVRSTTAECKDYVALISCLIR
jgi:hypothetical protein